METTQELIEKCLLISLGNHGYKNLRYYAHQLNGNVLKIQYAYDYSYDEGSSYDNYLEVELLDYINFLFSLK